MRQGWYGGLLTHHRHFQVWDKLKAANLDAAYPILAALYSADKGRVARYPACMFRFWLPGETHTISHTISISWNLPAGS